MPAKENLTTIEAVNNTKSNGIWTVVEVSGMPGANYGTLIFLPCAGNYKGQQIYFPTGGSPVAQRRLYANGGWSDWFTMPSYLSNYSTLSDLASALGGVVNGYNHGTEQVDLNNLTGVRLDYFDTNYTTHHPSGADGLTLLSVYWADGNMSVGFQIGIDYANNALYVRAKAGNQNWYKTALANVS